MEKYGHTIKKIREDKGFTQKETYSGIVSKTSAISFEKGNSDMRLSLFIKVLDALMITFEEFIYLHHHFHLPYLKKKWKEYSYATNRHDLKTLGVLIKEISTPYSMQEQLLKSASILSYHRIQNTMNPMVLKKYPIKEINTLKNFLFEIETWTKNEFILFINVLIYFDSLSNKILMETALKSIRKWNGLIEYPTIYSTLLLNYIEECFKRSEFDEGNYYLHELDLLNEDFLLAYQKIVYIYLEGITFLNDELLVKGRQQCESSLKILTDLGFKEQASMLRKDFEFIFSRSK